MIRTVITALVLIIAATPAAAGEWELIVNPYFAIPNTDGKFGIGPLETRLSSSPSDVFRKLNWGVMGAVEINNGEWGIALDANYLNLDITNDDIRRLSLNGHQAAYTLTVLKRIDPHTEVYVGAKLSSFGVQLSCNTVCPQPLDPRFTGSRSRNRSWIEPVVGLRARLPFSDRWDLTVMADVGGFKAGSDISANVWPQIGYRLGERAKVMAGYRIIYIQYDEGEGAERFLYDAATFGPTVGVEFSF